MDKPFAQLNKFFELAAERKLSGSDQLVYLHLFNAFNRAHWTETLRVKDRQLQELVRLYDADGKPTSIAAIRRAKQRLKAKGFIDFKAGKGSDATEYRLIKLYPDDTPVDTPIDTPIDTPVDTFGRSNYACAKDVKTENVKTPDKKEKKAGASEKNFQSMVKLDSDVRHAWIQVRSATSLTIK